MHGFNGEGTDGQGILCHIAGWDQNATRVTLLNAMEGEHSILIPLARQIWGPAPYVDADGHPLMTVMETIENTIAEDPGAFANGFNLVCHSQGGVICRALIEHWDGHNVSTFVSLAGPQMGVQGLGGITTFLSDRLHLEGAGKRILDYLTDAVVASIADDVWVPLQEQYLPGLGYTGISAASYWHDVSTPQAAQTFQRLSAVLSPMNNLAPLGRCEQPLKTRRWPCSGDVADLACETSGMWWPGSQYECAVPAGFAAAGRNGRAAANFGRLRHAVFLGSPQDGTIEPWQSTVWGYYAEGSGPADGEGARFEEWQQSDIARLDLLPLVAMNETGRFETHLEPNIKHVDWCAHPPTAYKMMAKYYGHLL